MPILHEYQDGFLNWILPYWFMQPVALAGSRKSQRIFEKTLSGSRSGSFHFKLPKRLLSRQTHTFDHSATLATDRSWAVQLTARVGNTVVRRGGAKPEFDVNDAEDRVQDEIRPAQEVARRSLALFAVVGTALGGPRGEVISWLRSEGLWGELTPHEVAYLEQTNAPPKAHINFGWQSERLIVLLWALGKIQELPDSATQCDTSVFKSVLPPFRRTSAQAFIAQATLIDEDSLWKQADFYLEDHWKARDAQLHERSMPPGIDIEIVQERHHAIN